MKVLLNRRSTTTPNKSRSSIKWLKIRRTVLIGRDRRQNSIRNRLNRINKMVIGRNKRQKDGSIKQNNSRQRQIVSRGKQMNRKRLIKGNSNGCKVNSSNGWMNNSK